MSWCVARKASSPGLLLAESTALPTLRELTKHKTENTQHAISFLASKSIQENTENMNLFGVYVYQTSSYFKDISYKLE